MNDKRLKEIVVPPEAATFWLDRRGNWCNRHGRFQHRKIVAYFHASIGRDEKGYFVSQINGDIREKVYFHYEDTALFVFDVQVEDGVILVLNTGRRIRLDPASLFIRHDCLYVRQDGELIKFTEKSMLQIAPWVAQDGEQCYLMFKGKRFAIPMAEDKLPPGESAGPPNP